MAALKGIEQQHVEAAIRLRPAREVQARRRQQAASLCVGDALGRAAEARAASIAHFGEDQRPAFLRDQVDLAVAAAPVARQDPQPCPSEELGDQLFGLRTRLVHVRLTNLQRSALTHRVTGTLYVVATPIGNLADASPRSIEVLRRVAVIACEDTRTSQALLARFDISTPTTPLHAHNERRAGAKLLQVLQAGKDVALVSDAGTPGISDPGGFLVENAHRAGIRVVPVPGPSAASAAVSASGFAGGGYLFAGFLPATGAARRKALAALKTGLPVVFYEAPHRVLDTVKDLAERFGTEREIVIARELTKKFEEVARIRLGEASAWLSSGPHRQQGEFVLVLASAEERVDPLAEGERVLALLLESLPASDAAKLAARITGAPRNALYRLALERSK